MLHYNVFNSHQVSLDTIALTPTHFVELLENDTFPIESWTHLQNL
jgi:hypothetical protein